MAQNNSRFTALNRAATVVTLIISAGFVVIGFVAELPLLVGVFAVLGIAALAVAPWRSAPSAPGASRR